MTKEKKVVSIALVPDLPVGTVFVFDGKKQKYEVVPREMTVPCGGCVFEWDRLPIGKKRTEYYHKCASFRCCGPDRKDGRNVKVVKVRSAKSGKEV